MALCSAWGCNRPATAIAPVFADVYAEYQALPAPAIQRQAASVRLTISAADMPLRNFARWISEESGISIVIDKSVDAVPITLELHNQSVEDTLTMLARRAGVQVTRVGDVYYIGVLRSEDRGLLVRRVRRLAVEEIAKAVGVLASENGRVELASDGLLIFADRVEVLQRVMELLDKLESSEVSCWLLQFYLISISDSASLRLGFDITPSATISYSLAGLSSQGVSTVDLALKSILQASREVRGVSIISSPFFLLLDGEKAVVKSGQKIPIPKKSVSDMGTVVTQGFESVDIGLSLDVSIREVSPDIIKVLLAVELSELAGYVEQSPITRSDSLSNQSLVKSQGVYILGQLQRRQDGKVMTGVVPSVFQDDSQSSLLQVWCKAYRIRAASASAGVQEPAEGRAAQL